VQFSSKCENLSYNYGENLIPIVVFKIFVGASAPTTMNIASPLLLRTELFIPY
jgi:hypothetical protein